MMRRKLSLAVAALGAALLLGGCGTQLEDARPAFGYSGLAAGDPALSSYEQAKADFMAARYGLAVKRFQMAMAEDPASVEAANGLAAAYDQLGRYDLAERYYRRALAMEPTSVQTLNNFGYSLMLQGRHELALAFFRDAARIDPDNEVIAANAERTVAARMEDRSHDLVAAAKVVAASVPSAAKARRIVRVTASEQLLRVQPQPAIAVASQGPAIAPPPLLPVETQSLPALPGPALPGPVAPGLEATPIAVRPTVRIAAAVAAEDAVVPAGPSEAPRMALALDGSVELANGNGRRHMAARLKAYLAQLGLAAARLSNADHFTYAATTITYRPGHRGLAEALSASLPVAPLLQQVTEQAADVRIQLGADLLEFDRGLLQAERNTSHADAI
jgi:tetratricopeptide (TPR) repeat protein